MTEEKIEEKLEEKIKGKKKAAEEEEEKAEAVEKVESSEKIGEEKTSGAEKEKIRGKKKEEKPKKTSAKVNGKDLGTSLKHSIAICNLIRGKRIDDAIENLEKVLKKKKAVPMKGEIPHRDRKGKQEKIMSGRYPINATKIFINLLKSLAANVSVNGLDIEKTKIIIAKANRASRPLRRFGITRFKRAHVSLEAREIEGNEKKFGGKMQNTK